MIMDLLITMNSSIYRQSRIFSITTTCILNYCEIVPSMQFKPSFFSSARKVIQYKWFYFPSYYKQVKRKLFAILDNRNWSIPIISMTKKSKYRFTQVWCIWHSQDQVTCLLVHLQQKILSLLLKKYIFKFLFFISV